MSESRIRNSIQADVQRVMSGRGTGRELGEYLCNVVFKGVLRQCVGYVYISESSIRSYVLCHVLLARKSSWDRMIWITIIETDVPAESI